MRGSEGSAKAGERPEPKSGRNAIRRKRRGWAKGAKPKRENRPEAATEAGRRRKAGRRRNGSARGRKAGCEAEKKRKGRKRKPDERAIFGNSGEKNAGGD